VIDAAPTIATYGTPFQIDTAQAGSIAKVALVRLGAVTHSVNMEQRYVPLSFTTGSGSLVATAPASANVAPPGVYMLFVIAADGVPSVAKMVTVAGNSGPSVSLTQPAAGAAFVAPASIGVVASASDPDGSVAKVEFFNGATKLGEDTSAPYSYDWTNVPAGSYSITARATDNLGAETTSAARTVTVSATNLTPTTAITAPTNGASFPWKPKIMIEASASDADGSITRVEFYRDNGVTLLGSDTAAPYAYRWNNVPSGTHSLRVRAYDNRGAVTLSTAVNITVRAR
jgi:hypothetical protein